MQLGEMLVRAKAISPADIDEGISWQVLYGGRLGLNLMELGLLDEKILAECLGKQLACESTYGEIDLPEAMIQMIPGTVARRHELVPWKLEGKRLKVLCISPAENLSIFDEVGFKTGKLIKPVVAPEFRVHQALRRFYGSVRQMRAIDFGMKPKGKRQQDAEKKAETDALENAADLMNDDEFSAIYAQLTETRPAAPAPAAPLPAPAPAPAAAAPLLTPVDDDLPILDGEILEGEVIEDDEAPAPQTDWASAFSDIEKQIEAAAPPPPPPADLSPLTFKEAVAAIGKAEGRDAVARAVLRYARSKAARAVLLNVQGDVALGWDAVGEGLDPESAKRIAFPLSVPSVFRLVRESRSHYIGPLGKDAGNVRFLKLAGKKWPASAVLLPVLFRGKVVYILYVDNGHKLQVDPDVGELLILSQNISRSMEQMIAKRQAAKKG